MMHRAAVTVVRIRDTVRIRAVSPTQKAVVKGSMRPNSLVSLPGRERKVSKRKRSLL